MHSKAVGRKPVFGGEAAPYAALFILVFYLRFLVASHTTGTNDALMFERFAGAAYRDFFGAYGHYANLNHPPLALVLLRALYWFSNEMDWAFGFVLRAASIAADAGCLAVIWKLLKGLPLPRRRWIWTACLLNPVTFLIASFHGQTDPVMMLGLLISIYALQKGNNLAGGFFFALSAGIKLFPLLLAPAFLVHFWRRRRADPKAMFHFGLAAGPVLAAVFLPHWFADPDRLVENVFKYGAIFGIWGIPAVLQDLYRMTGFEPLASVLGWYWALGRLTCAAVPFGIFWLLRKSDLNQIEAVFVCTAAFLFLANGFSVQYLSWYAYFAMIAFPALGTVFALTAGFFVIRVYGFWSGWKAPWFANSWAAGQWIGVDILLDRLIWLMIGAGLIAWVVHKIKKSETV